MKRLIALLLFQFFFTLPLLQAMPAKSLTLISETKIISPVSKSTVGYVSLIEKIVAKKILKKLTKNSVGGAKGSKIKAVLSLIFGVVSILALVVALPATEIIFAAISVSAAAALLGIYLGRSALNQESYKSAKLGVLLSYISAGIITAVTVFVIIALGSIGK